MQIHHYIWEPIGGAPHRPVGFFWGPGGFVGPQMSPWGSWGCTTCSTAVSHQGALTDALMSQCILMAVFEMLNC